MNETTLGRMFANADEPLESKSGEANIPGHVFARHTLPLSSYLVTLVGEKGGNWCDDSSKIATTRVLDL